MVTMGKNAACTGLVRENGSGDGDMATMMVPVVVVVVVVSMVPPERVSSFISHRRSGPPIQRDVLMAEPCWN